MKRLFILFSLILISFFSLGQNRNSVWCFGDSAGIDFTNLTNPIPFSSGMDSRGSCVSIADTNGNLIMYAATMPYFGPSSARATKIFNSQHLMLNDADSITGEAWYNELSLIPKPGSDSLYYIFSNTVGPGLNQGMYYTLVDRSLNNGLGAVVQQNIQVDTNVYSDCLTAIKHGNGRDWWVISKWSTFSLVKTNRFFVFRVTPDSVYGPMVQNLGNVTDGDFPKIIWHPAQDKFMLIAVTGYMAEYNFDRCTGVISLSRIIFQEQPSNFNRLFWEGAYSPNGNLFYVSRNSWGGNFGVNNYLLQYDLTATNIPASCDTLDSTMYPPVDCGAVRLAPDGKIYYSQAYISLGAFSYPYADSMRNVINENLGVINNPDVAGSGCNFAPFSFYLGGKRTYYGLPNNPNYSLGASVGSACDTLTGIEEFAQKSKSIKLHVAPNPVTNTLYFNAQQVSGRTAFITIQNTLGSLVFKKDVTVLNGGYVTLPVTVSGFINGIYIITLHTDNEVASTKFIKE